MQNGPTQRRGVVQLPGGLFLTTTLPPPPSAIPSTNRSPPALGIVRHAAGHDQPQGNGVGGRFHDSRTRSSSPTPTWLGRSGGPKLGFISVPPARRSARSPATPSTP